MLDILLVIMRILRPSRALCECVSEQDRESPRVKPGSQRDQSPRTSRAGSGGSNHDERVIDARVPGI